MNINHTTLRQWLWTSVLWLGVAALVCLVFVMSIATTQAALDVPQLINYQGRLTDDDRITVADGSYDMAFAIYDASSGGTCLWSADDTLSDGDTTMDCTGDTPDGQISVTVTDGIFSVLLGDTGQNPLEDTLFDDNENLWIGVTIESDSEMTPRRQIGAAPFALQAGDSDLLDSLDTDAGANGCTDACVPATDANGNLTIAGNPEGTDVEDASLFINPASAGSQNKLFGIADNGTERFWVNQTGQTKIASHASIGPQGDPNSTDVLELEQNFNAITATRRMLHAISSISGASNPSGVFIGSHSDLDVASGAGNDAQSVSGFLADIDHDGSGTTDDLWGGDYNVVVSAGTATTAYGNDSRVSTDGGTITTGYGTYSTVTESSGTITTGYGGYFTSTGATTNHGIFAKASSGTTDYAIYASEGIVHIEGDDDPSDTTYELINGAGDLFVKDDVEVLGAFYVSGFESSTTSLSFSNPSVEWNVFIDQPQEGISGDKADTDTVGLLMNNFSDAVGSGGNKYGFYGIKNIHTYGDNLGAGTDTEVYGMANYLYVQRNVDFAYGVHADVAVTGGGSTNPVYGGWFRAGTGAAVTSATSYGIRAEVEERESGTVTTAYAGYFKADTDAGTAYAIYTDEGQVWIEGDGSATTATFNDVATNTDGTVFIQGDTEIFDGSLCVGDGGAGASSPGGNCANATGTDGVIYSVNTSVTQHDLAEMFPSQQFLLAGEIVSVSDDGEEHVERATDEDIVIGAISTAPGLTLGWETEADNHYPVALTGRAPVKISDENGTIAIGDRITVGSTEGIGMKATEAGEVVGIAMESFDGTGQGAVMTFIQPHYWDGVSVASVTTDEPSSAVQTDVVLSINGGSISNVQSLAGYNWTVDQFGEFKTDGAYLVDIKSHQGDTVTTAAVLSLDHYVTLAGTTIVKDGSAPVKFEDVAPEFNDIISAELPIVVTATVSNGSGTVYVTDKSMNGFRLHGSGDGDEIDWIVMAYRKDYEPEELLEVDEEEEEVVEEEVEEEGDEEVTGEEEATEGDAEGEETDTPDEETGGEAVEEEPEEEVTEEAPEEVVEEEPLEEADEEAVVEEESEAEATEEEVTEEETEEEVVEVEPEEEAIEEEPVEETAGETEETEETEV